jgi:hypothetical protein
VAYVASTTALSALLPGAGQYRLGKKRAWAYMAVESAAWVVYAERRVAAGRARDRYRDFAWTRARLQTGTRNDGDFAYYETLSKWPRSGAFDGDPLTVGLQPETDPAAYNGSIWSRAERIFRPAPGAMPGDPQLEGALAYYRERAYGDEFLWDWTGAAPDQAAYGGLIKESDARFRRATNALGVLLANHLVSAVDAFLDARGLESPLVARFTPWTEAPPGAWALKLEMSLR